jgi:hypothetical protein
MDQKVILHLIFIKNLIHISLNFQSILIISVDTQYTNPFLFIIGLSCPRSVQTSLTQNFLKLTLPGFPYNLLPVPCGDIGFKKALVKY